jgi:hypothetical protein
MVLAGADSLEQIGRSLIFHDRNRLLVPILGTVPSISEHHCDIVWIYPYHILPKAALLTHEAANVKFQPVSMPPK